MSKTKVKQEPAQKVEELTYRLCLMDSSHRAVQIDFSFGFVMEGIETLIASYRKLLQDEIDYKKAAEEKDKEVADKLEATHKEKQEALPSYQCNNCSAEWRGGSPEICPQCECKQNE